MLRTIQLCFDDWFEVAVQTFTDRWGTAAGRGMEAAVEGAVGVLLEMDEVVAEVQRWRRVAHGDGPLLVALATHYQLLLFLCI